MDKNVQRNLLKTLHDIATSNSKEEYNYRNASPLKINVCKLLLFAFFNYFVAFLFSNYKYFVKIFSLQLIKIGTLRQMFFVSFYECLGVGAKAFRRTYQQWLPFMESLI